MFERAADFYKIFRAGQSVADAVHLKNKQNLGNAIAVLLGLLVAVAKAYGVNIPLDDGQLVQLGGAAAILYGMFNVGATVASTDKIGLLPWGKTTQDTLSHDTVVEQPVPDVVEAIPAVSNDVSHVDPNYPALNGLDATYYNG